jgi:hypothetical protein
LLRNDFGAGLTNGESDGGGLDEFVEFIPKPAPQLSIFNAKPLVVRTS